MTGYNSTIRIGVDASAAASGAQQFAQSMAAMQSAATSMSASVTNVQRSIASLQGGFQQTSQSMASLQASMAQSAASMQQSMAQAANSVQQSVQNINRSMASAGTGGGGGGGIGSSLTGVLSTIAHIGSALTGVTMGLSAFAAIHLGKELVEVSDEWTTLKSRIGSATQANQDFAYVYEKLFDISQKTGVSMENTVGAFQQLSRIGGEFGLNDSQLLKITQAMEQSAVLGGATQAQLRRGMMDFEHFISDTSNASALRGVFTQLPELMNQISKAVMGADNRVSEFRQKLKDGDIGSADILAGVLKAAVAIDSQFDKLPPTVSRASQSVKDAFAKALNDNTAESVQTLARGLNLLAANMDIIVSKGLSLAEVLGVALAGRAISAAITGFNTMVTGGAAAAAALEAERAASAAAAAENIQLAETERAVAVAAEQRALAQQAAARQALASATAEVAAARAGAPAGILTVGGGAEERQARAAASLRAANDAVTVSSGARAAAEERVAMTTAAAATATEGAATAVGILRTALVGLASVVNIVFTLIAAWELLTSTLNFGARSMSEQISYMGKMADQAGQASGRVKSLTDDMGDLTKEALSNRIDQFTSDVKQSAAAVADLQAKLKSGSKLVSEGDLKQAQENLSVQKKALESAVGERNARFPNPPPVAHKVADSGGDNDYGYTKKKRDLEQDIQDQNDLALAYTKGEDAIAEAKRKAAIDAQAKDLNPKLPKTRRDELLGLIEQDVDAKNVVGLSKYVAETTDQVNKQKEFASALQESNLQYQQAQIEQEAYAERVKLGVKANSDAATAIRLAIQAKKEADNYETLGKETQKSRNATEVSQAAADDTETSARGRQRNAQRSATQRQLRDMDVSEDSGYAKALVSQQTMEQDAKDAELQRQRTVALQNQLEYAQGNLQIAGLTGKEYDLQKAALDQQLTVKQEFGEVDNAELERQKQISEEIARVQYQIKLSNDSLGQLGKMDTLGALRDTTATALGDVENSLVDIVTGAKSAKEAFADMAKNIANDLAHLAIRMLIIRPLAMMFGGMMGGGGMMMGEMAGGMAMAGAQAGGAAFADGGIMTSMGKVNLKSYAGGGVADSPQLAMFGEGSSPEAYVPLPNGNAIPVQMKGAGKDGMAGSVKSITSAPINVTVNQPPGADAKQGAQFGDAIAKAVEAQVTRIMIREKRNGGILDPYGMKGF